MAPFNFLLFVLLKMAEKKVRQHHRGMPSRVTRRLTKVWLLSTLGALIDGFWEPFCNPTDLP